MVALSTILSVSLAAVGALASPAPKVGDTLPIEKRQSTSNSEGVHDGFFYSFWSDGATSVNYTNLASGSYRVEWERGESVGNFYGGKGWKDASMERSIQFSGTYEADGNSYLGIYGWMLNPRREYYILENFGTFDPSIAMQHVGTVSCDGGDYDLGVVRRVSMGLDPIMYTYWSIRRQKRTEGIVSTGCHFDAWLAAGLELGSQYSYIVATEGYGSSGFAEITVADAG